MAPLATSSFLLFSALTAISYAAPQTNSDQAAQFSAEQAGQLGVSSSLSSVYAACSANFQPSCTSYGVTAPASASAIPTAATTLNSDQAAKFSFEQSGQQSVQSSLSSVIAACSANFQPSCTSYGVSGPATVSATATGATSAQPSVETSSITKAAGPGASLTSGGVSLNVTPTPTPGASTPGSNSSTRPSGSGASGSVASSRPSNGGAAVHAGAGSAAIGVVGVMAAYFL